MSPIEVACVGLATADTIVGLPSWPDPDGRAVADALVRSSGGPAATAAVTLARLGHRAALFGAVGDDEAGEDVRAGLAAEEVDVTHVATLPGRTSESVILIDTSRHTRAILHAPGVSLAELGADARAACAAAAWTHADHVGYALTGLLDRSRLSVDAGQRMDGLHVAGLGLYAPAAATLTDHLDGKSVEQAVLAARAAGAERVVVTLGADGAIAADATGTWRIAAPAVEVVSTLGAGDVFHGALLASLLEGRTLPEAARRATVAASLSCRALDGRSAIPRSAELDAAMAGAPAVEPMLLKATR